MFDYAFNAANQGTAPVQLSPDSLIVFPDFGFCGLYSAGEGLEVHVFPTVDAVS